MSSKNKHIYNKNIMKKGKTGKKINSYFNTAYNSIPHNVITITITDENIAKVNDYVDRALLIKIEEHGQDNRNERKRLYSGMLGEVAIEQLLGVKFINWSVGHSSLYNSPDLEKLGLNIGIKTVEFGKFPIIHRHSVRPEIILVKLDYKTIAICGYATVKILNRFQEDKLILSPNVSSNKTGFYGFHKLKNCTSLFDLKHIASLIFSEFNFNKK